MKKYIQLMRPKHYAKNALLLFPLFFSGQLFDYSLFIKVMCGIVVFSIISSAIYIINDIRDVKSDRLHHTKCHRPIASGVITVPSAWAFACILLVCAIAIHILMDSTANALAILFLYFILNLCYSFGLKNIPIVDISILVSGFLLRVLYGSVLTGIEISSWLYLSVIAVSFYLALGKRRNELSRQSTGSTRKVLQFYNHAFLDKNMYMCLALTIVFYSLWSVDPHTIDRLQSPHMIMTVPLVILICMKYSLTVEGNSDGDPVEIIFKDKWLLGLIFILAFTAMWIIYF